MKYLFIALITCCCFVLNAQELTYAQVHDSTKKPSGTFTSYVAKSGEVFTAGEKIKIGLPSNGHYFNFIQIGDPGINGLKKASSMASSDEIEIKKIVVWGNKRVGWYASIRTVGGVAGYNIEVENALQTGELISSVMSSDQALEELKKAKDKLDLDLITQEEYDKIKESLIPFIK